MTITKKIFFSIFAVILLSFCALHEYFNEDSLFYKILYSNPAPHSIVAMVEEIKKNKPGELADPLHQNATKIVNNYLIGRDTDKTIAEMKAYGFDCVSYPKDKKNHQQLYILNFHLKEGVIALWGTTIGVSLYSDNNKITEVVASYYTVYL